MIAGIFASSWVAGSIVAVLAGVIGFFVVLRGSVFAAHALPLGAFPAVAAARLWGLDLLATVLAFSVLGAAVVAALSRRTRRDIATALWLVLMLGAGELILSRLQGYSRAVYGLFFGQLLGVTPADLHMIAGVGAVAVVLVLIAFRPLLLSGLSADLAAVAGVPAGLLDLVFLTLVALAAAAALPAVGALLVFSLMVGPASAARMVCDRPLPGLALSVALALATVWGALLLASATGWPVGFFVGVAGLGLYVAGRLAGRGYAPLRR